ncbi:ABC transporter permease [Okibacterium endophyticum]
MSEHVMTGPIRRKVALPRAVAKKRWVVSPALVICSALVLVAILAPWIAPYDPLQVDPLNANLSPSWTHLLGTDDLGRDLLSRLLHGARLSLAGPAIIVLVAVAIGVSMAFVAAWYGGWVNSVIGRVVDVMLSFPGLILAIAVVSIFGAGFLPPVMALAVAYAPMVARVLRPVVQRERNLAYVVALVSQGASTPRIWFRHLLPNVASLVVVQSAIFYGYAMLDLAAISFLGLGVQPPAPEWGTMAATGQSALIAGYPMQSVAAAAIVTVSVVSFNVLGEHVARRYEIQEFA